MDVQLPISSYILFLVKPPKEAENFELEAKDGQCRFSKLVD